MCYVHINKLFINKVFCKNIIDSRIKTDSIPSAPSVACRTRYSLTHSFPILICLYFLGPCYFIPLSLLSPSCSLRLSLLFRSSFPGNWAWVLVVEGKRLGWNCWELCVYMCVCAGKWANKGRWSMKGLEQRHSQLPNAWTRPQGPRTHILSLPDSHTKPSIHLIYVYMERGQWRA